MRFFSELLPCLTPKANLGKPLWQHRRTLGDRFKQTPAELTPPFIASKLVPILSNDDPSRGLSRLSRCLTYNLSPLFEVLNLEFSRFKFCTIFKGLYASLSAQSRCHERWYGHTNMNSTYNSIQSSLFIMLLLLSSLL